MRAIASFAGRPPRPRPHVERQTAIVQTCGPSFMDLYEDGFLIDGAGSRGINNSNFYNHGSSSSLFKKANYTLVSDSNDEEDDS